MRARGSTLLTLGTILIIGATTVSASPVSLPAGQTAKSHLAGLVKAGLWCRLGRPTTEQLWQRRWADAGATMRPKWIVAPRWPQLFADGRYTSLSLDPIRRRPWWE